MFPFLMGETLDSRICQGLCFIAAPLIAVEFGLYTADINPSWRKTWEPLIEIIIEIHIMYLYIYIYSIVYTRYIYIYIFILI